MSIAPQRMLILASSSPRRQELIRTLRLPYETIAGDVDESVPSTWPAAKVVETLSLRKAMEAVKRMEDAGRTDGIIIGADTIVVQNGTILGKPNDVGDAVRMLEKLQGRSHEVFTGVACVDVESGKASVKHQVTRVKMRPITMDQIESYVATGEPMDKAGSYAIQGIGATIVQAIEGCYFNVVGLPLSLLSEMLKEFDIHVL